MRARLLLSVILLAAVPVVAALGLLAYANSDGGRHALERLVERQSGGTVKITGLTGPLPGRIGAARIELVDGDGAWATIEQAALAWSPAALSRGEVSITSLTAGHAALLRRPVPEAGGSSGGGLPLRVVLREMRIDRLDLAEAVVGAAASLSLSGDADLASLWSSRLDLAVLRLGGEGDYRVHAVFGGNGSQVELAADEPAGGFLARLAELPDLGRLHLTGTLAGPPEAEKVDFRLEAGPLKSEAHGTADVTHRRLDLDVGLLSPAMAPRPDLSWRSAGLEAHVHGDFLRPEAEGRLTVEGVASGESSVDRVEADLHGKDGKLALSARLIRLRPAGAPDLFGATPVDLTVGATLTGPEQPVEFTLSHPLLRAQGTTALTEDAAVSGEAVLPDLAALAPLTGLDLHGKGTVTGSWRPTGAVSADARIEEGREILHVAANGTATAGRFDLTWSAQAADLARLGAPMPGSVAAKGSLQGSLSHFQAAAEAQGRLAEAPLTLSLKLDRGESGATRIAIDRARWKSVEAGGTLDLQPGRASGRLRAKAGDLGDFSPFAGVPLTGEADASLEMAPGKTPRALVRVEVRQLTWPDGTLDRLLLEGSFEDPLGHPATDLKLSVEQARAAGFAGNASLSAEGPETALKLALSADLQGPKGPASLAAGGTVSLPRRSIDLSQLNAAYSGQSAHLLAPAAIAFGPQVRLNGVRLGVGPAEISVDGQAAPRMALDIAVRKVDLAAFFKAKGILTADAHLRGDPGAPDGDVHVTGRDLRWQNSPRLTLDAQARLDQGMARVDARLDSGKTGAVTVGGSVPVGQDGTLDLSVKGTLDLALLDPVLAAAGREARGKLSLDAGIGGSFDAPAVTGSAALHEVSVQDYAQGVHLSGIEGTLQAQDGAVVLTGVSGRAGRGRFTLEGRIGVSQPGLPVDLALSGRNIRPFSSDLLTADMNADLALGGALAGGLSLSGKVKVNRADINIPESLPTSVAVLKVTKKGGPPPAPEQPPPPVTLDVGVDAPQQVFVRGRGVDAEMGGRLHVGGSADDPQIEGGFDLRNGTLSLAGQSLTVTRGKIGFTGGGPGGKLDPSLDLVSESSSNGIVATLTVGGYADAPTIKLTSTPDLPQDEILSRLLFNESASQLSPLQMASIAQGVASMSGVGGGFDPLAMLRRTLGIDRLSVTNTNNGTGSDGNTLVEAGKYVATGVYVGTRQGLNGGTQARVQIDLTRHLKLDTLIGTGGGTPATGATIDNDPGSSIGLTYQFDY